MALQESCYALKPSRGEWQEETQLGRTRDEGKPYRGAFRKRNRPKAGPATVGLTWASKTGLKLRPKIGPKTDVGLRPNKRIN